MGHYKRGYLSPVEREDIKRLYSSGNYSIRKLATHYQVGKSTIARVVKEPVDDSIKRSNSTSSPPPGAVANSQRIDSGGGDFLNKLFENKTKFKESKLLEIDMDLNSCRSRGSVNVLPALHRLHLSLFDEIQAIKEEEKEMMETLETEGIINSILSTINQLPPILKQRLKEEIEAQNPKVISFPTALNEDE